MNMFNSGTLIVFGFGGHARSIADVAIRCGYDDLIFVDNNAKSNEKYFGYKVVKSIDIPDLRGVHAFAAAGEGLMRESQCALIEKSGMKLVSLISPTATLSVGASVASGCFIGNHAHIGSSAQIGYSSIVNTCGIVEHDSNVGPYSHVSINSSIAGRSSLGRFSMLGANSVIIDGLVVSDFVLIGAGGVVVNDILSPGVYVGNPAKRISDHPKK